MRFLDLFNEIEKGSYALTDEAVYYSIKNNDEMIPLWGGNKSHNKVDRMVSKSAKTKDGQDIKIFSGEGIIISLDGSAGSMTYKKGEVFALNHHAGFITVRPDKKELVNLEYFALFYQNFYRSLAVSDGSKTLSLKQIYNEEFEIPSINIQNRIMRKLTEVKYAVQKLDNLKPMLLDILAQEVTINYTTYQAQDVPISKVLGYMSGNSGLTEEFIYKSLQNQGTRYKILSSSTEESTLMGEIPMCEINGNPLKVFSDRKGLLVTRNGKAGRTKFLDKGNYTINDHAYILFLLDDCPYDIDLRWLAIQYRPEFLSYSSNSENGTWNMTGFFKYVRIDIPSVKEQLQLINLWEKAELLVNRIDKIQLRMDNLLSKELALVN